ncbi:MAG: hypothetical protein ABUK08_07330 [Candidatus Humimicrobiaceae bacterium]
MLIQVLDYYNKKDFYCTPCPSFKEPAFVELIGGPEYVLSRRGYCLSVFGTRQNIERELEIANIRDNSFRDGVILSSVFPLNIHDGVLIERKGST